MPGGETHEMSQSEFAAYAEHVFRHHNEVVNRLIAAFGSDDGADEKGSTELTKAETRMLQACAPLNEVVSDSLGGETATLGARMGLLDVVPACEAATEKVEDLLP
jgi:hypothetical protein